MIRRGDIWIADLGVQTRNCGSEQRGVRPVLIIQNDVGNFYSPTVIVAPITDGNKRYMPTHVKVSWERGIGKDSVAMLEQIRTLERTKLRKWAGSAGEIMNDVDRAIRLSLGLERG
ncbi:type II toxin-antitoxin system PemK/MazF family toxin [Paenibacillus sp. GYB004]|uniref:type II toxin-antitoxin system PemK/MazF family toxin n=1 Tax=Paenibacillus sp. GYB004 TaxID=2994393 RepID=UPI002F96D2D9